MRNGGLGLDEKLSAPQGVLHGLTRMTYRLLMGIVNFGAEVGKYGDAVAGHVDLLCLGGVF